MIEKDANLAELLKSSLTSNLNISETVNHSIINITIFWKCATSPFICLHVNCFNILRFFAEVSTKLQKIPFFRQFNDHCTGGEDGNLTNEPIFSIYFFRSNCCGINFWIWKYSKFVFMWSHLWSNLVCKIPQFLAKRYRFWQFIILFQKVDTLRLLKICIIFCPPAGVKDYSRWTIVNCYWTYIFKGSIYKFSSKHISRTAILTQALVITCE